MKLLTESEVKNWCKTAGITILRNGQACFDGMNSYAVHTPIPDRVARQYVLLSEVFAFFESGSEYVTLMDDCNVFSHDNGVVEILGTFRKTYCNSKDILERPGYWFDASESELAFGLMRIIAAFEWDATFFSTRKRHIVWRILDEHLILETKEKNVLEEITRQMRATGTDFKWMKQCK